MKIDVKEIGRAFKPNIIAKAVRAFDRATMVVVLTCWGSALLIFMMAIYTINMSVKAKREALEAAAMEPSVPKIVSKSPEQSEMQPLTERLKKRFPEIIFALNRDNSLNVVASEVKNFRLWLTVLSYIDTISPQYRWTIKEFCVGLPCGREKPMSATVMAEKISFSAPSTEER